VGYAGFSSGEADYPSIAIYNNTPYVAFSDYVNGTKATVMKYGGTNWTFVGSGAFSAAGVGYTTIAIDGSGTPYVAFSDYANYAKATVMKCNGSNWAIVGSAAFSPGGANFTSIAIDGSGTPYIVYSDAYNAQKATVKKFNGSSWVAVGSAGFSTGQANFTSIAIDGSGTPYVAYMDVADSNKATVMKYNGSSWVAVGSAGFSSGGATSISMALDGSGMPYVAFVDGSNGSKATAMKYNGSSWQIIGSAGFSPGQAVTPSIAVDAGNTTYVAYQDGTNMYKATVMKYNGSAWVAFGNADFSAGRAGGTVMAISGTGMPYVAYQDSVHAFKATVQQIQTPGITLGTSPSACAGTTTASLSYSATTNTPTTYSVRWSSAAIAQGFTNVTSATLPSSPISITMPATAATGTYSDTIVVYNSSCLSPGIISSVTVLPMVTPSVTITANPGNIVSPGTTVSFTATGINAGPTPTYWWKINGSVVSSGGNTFSTSSLNNGDVVTCMLTSSNLCLTVNNPTSNAITITIPVVSLTGTSNCPGSVLTLNSNMNPLQIVWKQNGTPVYTTNASWNINATTVAGQSNGTAGSTNSMLTYPYGVCVDGSGNVYVVDGNNHRVMKWAPGATSGTIVAGGNGQGSGANQLYNPVGIAIDTARNLYIADYANNRVQKWAPGATSGVTVATGINHPRGICMDAAGNLYATDEAANSVKKFLPGVTSGTIVAGNGSAGSGANQFSLPMDVFVDGSGNLYVADWSNGRIMKWAPGATSGTNVASIAVPIGLWVDVLGNIYLTTQNSVIYKFTNGSLVGDIVGAGQGQGAGSNQLNGPIRFCFDVNGNLYVSDRVNNRVQKFAINDTMTYTAASTGNYTATVTSFPGATATTSAYTISTGITPSVVISASPGNVVSQGSTVTFTAVPTNGGSIPSYQWKVNSSNVGANSTTYSTNTLNNGDVVTCVLTSNAACVSPLSVNSNSINIVMPVVSLSGTTHCPGSVLTVGSSINPLQIVWKLNGSAIQTTNAIWNANATTVAGQSNGTSGTGPAYLNMGGGGGVYADTGGNVYVADYNNHRIVKWAHGATSGTVVAGGNGQGSSSNQINGPSGVYVDAAGNVYVADAGNNRVMKWGPGATSGILVAGTGTAGSGASQLWGIQNVKVDVNGNIYIPDGSNNRVQKWAPGATSGTTVAGQSNGTGGSGLNQLSNPEDVFIDSSGNIYVADGGNHRIMRWAPGATSGTVVAGGNGPGSNPNQLNGPTGVFVDYFNNIYISDGSNNRIQKWTAGATSGTTIGGGNGAGNAANQLQNPIDLYFDASGDMYVADGSNNRVQEFTYSTSSLNDTATNAGNYTATVTTFTGATSITSSWTINSYPTLSSTSTPSAICNNTAFSYTPTSSVTGTTFNWSRAAVTGISNSAASGAGNPNETLVNTTTSPVVVTYVYTLSANGCTNPITYNVTVTVNPTPILSSTSTSSAICNNTNFSFTPTSNTAGATFAWSRAAVTGITNAAASGTGNPNETLVNASSNPLTVIYVYSLSANGCTNPTNYNVTVTVNPTPILSSSVSAPAICNNTTFSYTPTSSSSGTIFAWSRAVVTGITNAAASGMGNPGEILVNITYAPVIVSYVYTLSINSCTNPTNYYVTVTVNPTSVLNSSTTPSAICNNTIFSYSPVSTVSGTTFAWSRSAVAGISNTAASGTGNPNETLANTTTSPVTVTYIYTLTANGCANTQNVILTVNPSPVLTSALTIPSICNNGTFSYLPTSTTSGTTFSWSRAAVIGISNAAASGTGNPNETLIDTLFTPAVVIYIYTLSANGCTNPLTYSIVDTVLIAPHIIAQPLNDTVCAGANASFSVSVTGEGLTYQWKINSGSGFTNINNGGIYSGATTSTLTISGVTTGISGYQYQCNISGACVPAALTSINTLTVNAAPVITSAPSGSIVCAGGNTTFSVGATGVGLSYQWYVNPGSGFTALTNTGVYSGVTTNILSITAATASMSGNQYECIVSGGCSPPATTVAVLLFINLLPAVASQPSAIVICAGSNTSFSVSATGTALTYQWQLNTGSGFTNISNGGIYSGATTNTLNITGAAAAMTSYQYRCVVSGICTPSDTSNAVTLTVNTTPAITAQPANDTVCTAGNTSFMISATGSGLTYQWQVNNGAGYSNLNNAGIYSGATSNLLTITNTPVSVNGYQYRCIVSGTCTPPATSNGAVLIVNSLPSVTAQPNDSTICAGTNASFSVAATGTGISYQWQLSTGLAYSNISNGGVYNGATTNTLSISSAIASMNGYSYRCLVSGVCTPQAISNGALLNVSTAPHNHSTAF